MAVAKKMNIASYRVLKTLLFLFHNNLTMSELVIELEKSGYGPYNNYIVSKYIHTLKSCGIDIQKVKNRYCIVNFPFGMKLSSVESQLLYDIKTKCEKISVDDIGYVIARFFDKIHLPFYKSGMGLLSSPNHNVIKNVEQAYKGNIEVILTYLDDKQESGFIRNIKVVNGKYFFVLANQSEVKEINPDDVCNVALLNKKSKINEVNNSVIFELKGRLAERYQLRENEHIIKYKDNGSIVILNEYEDRHVLIQRLLRYDSFCKVIGPTDFLIEFKSVIQNSLINYEINPQRRSQKFIANELKKQKEKEKEKKRKIKNQEGKKEE